MNTQNKFLKEMILIIITLVPAIVLSAYWNALPEQLPMHWNVEGKVDGYGPKYLNAVLCIGLYLLLFVIQFLDPKKKNYEFFQSAYYKIRLVLAVFFSGISTMTVFTALGYAIDTPRVIITSILILFALIGNYLVNVKPNWFIGIRTPWTMENEEVWRKTHRVGGRLWFFGSILLLVLSFLIPIAIFTYIMIVVFGIMVVFPIVHSYILYKKVKKVNG